MIGCPETEKQKTAPLALCLQPPKTSVLILSSSTHSIWKEVSCVQTMFCATMLLHTMCVVCSYFFEGVCSLSAQCPMSVMLFMTTVVPVPRCALSSRQICRGETLSTFVRFSFVQHRSFLITCWFRTNGSC